MKRIVISAAALVLCIALGGCGRTEVGPEDTSGSGSASSATSSASAATSSASAATFPPYTGSAGTVSSPPVSTVALPLKSEADAEAYFLAAHPGADIKLVRECGGEYAVFYLPSKNSSFNPACSVYTVWLGGDGEEKSAPRLLPVYGFYPQKGGLLLLTHFEEDDFAAPEHGHLPQQCLLPVGGEPGEVARGPLPLCMAQGKHLGARLDWMVLCEARAEEGGLSLWSAYSSDLPISGGEYPFLPETVFSFDEGANTLRIETKAPAGCEIPDGPLPVSGRYISSAVCEKGVITLALTAEAAFFTAELSFPEYGRYSAVNGYSATVLTITFAQSCGADMAEESFVRLCER